MLTHRIAIATLVAAATAGCASYSHYNEPQGAEEQRAPSRASFQIDGARGNPRTLTFLALSGGGSRAAYFSVAAMQRLRNALPDTDLLAEVDAISAVSGGSMAAAYYASTHDDELAAPALAQRLEAELAQALRDDPEHAAALKLRRLLRTDGAGGRIRCRGAAVGQAGGDAAAWAWLRRQWQDVPQHADRLEQLCRQAGMSSRVWTDSGARKAMRLNYIARWIGNWLWPMNFARYWLTAYDRTDIMAQTLADNLYDSPWLGHDLRLGDLNPARPYLIINATNATEDQPGRSDDDRVFGSVFTFTSEDFGRHLGSDVRRFSLARAVMASSAFPFVFANSTLCDYRDLQGSADSDACDTGRYMHVFDGGNADNLGLRSIKRALFEMALDGRLAQYDRVVVLQIDAFTRPKGASASQADPRSLMSLLVDMNVTDAVDSLLQANRAALMGEFSSRRLHWLGKDCRRDSRQLPSSLCEQLKAHPLTQSGALDLADRLVFYHIGFEDLDDAGRDGDALGNAELKARLDRIGTSLSLHSADARALDQAAERILSPDNACLQALGSLVRTSGAVTPEVVTMAHETCRDTEGHGSGGTLSAGRTPATPAAPRQ